MKYTEEVKKAIEAMKNKLDNDENSWFYYDEIETIFDLLKKQQKEIEQLKKITNSYDSFIGNMSNKDTTIIIADKEYFDNGYFIEKYISKEAIRKKIKEIEENGYWDFLEERDCEKTINILKELLGDE